MSKVIAERDESGIVEGNLAVMTDPSPSGMIGHLNQQTVCESMLKHQKTRTAIFYCDGSGKIEMFGYVQDIPDPLREGLARGELRRGEFELLVVDLPERDTGIKRFRLENPTRHALSILEKTRQAYNSRYGFDPNRPLEG